MDRPRRPGAPQTAAGGVPRLLTGLGCTPAELGALALLVAGALAALGMFWLLAAPGGGGPGSVAQPVATKGVPGGVPAGVTVEAADLVVHVAGRVATPGVYRLPGGARVGDAVEVAGGALPDAALDSVNLARPLTDGEQLFVPGPAGAGPAGGGAAGAAAGAGAGATGASGAAGGPAPASARRPDGTLDLNRATPEELDELPGIGPVLTVS